MIFNASRVLPRNHSLSQYETREGFWHFSVKVFANDSRTLTPETRGQINYWKLGSWRCFAGTNPKEQLYDKLHIMWGALSGGNSFTALE